MTDPALTAVPDTLDAPVVKAVGEAGAPTASATPAGYELLGEIGRGGMGVVFRGRDVALNREVAVKILHEKYAPVSTAARRFVEEARITGQLQRSGGVSVGHGARRPPVPGHEADPQQHPRRPAQARRAD